MEEKQHPIFDLMDLNKTLIEQGKEQLDRSPTLRDFFAAAALCGFTSQPDCNIYANPIATECYDIADAMLAAREEENDG